MALIHDIPKILEAQVYIYLVLMVCKVNFCEIANWTCSGFPDKKAYKDMLGIMGWFNFW